LFPRPRQGEPLYIPIGRNLAELYTQGYNGSTGRPPRDEDEKRTIVSY
jgi:hypothetical protein